MSPRSSPGPSSPPPGRDPPPPAQEGPPRRACGTCTVCCKLPEIDWTSDSPVGRPPLKKPRNTWCTYCEPGRGCTIHADRPLSCAAFQCLWLMGLVPEDLRPDRVNAMFDVQGPYLTLLSDPEGPDPLADARVRAFVDDFCALRGRKLEVVAQPRPARGKAGRRRHRRPGA